MKKGFDEIINLGDMFKNARMHKGITIWQAVKSTHIREVYITALEKSDYAILPAVVYTKGFIKNYSKFLDIDVDTALAFYRREYEDALKIETIKPINKNKDKFNFSFLLTPKGLRILLLGTLFLIFISYTFYKINSIVSPPTFSLTYPISVFTNEKKAYNTTKEKITIKGKLVIGSTLKLNGMDVDTRNLEIFEISDLALKSGDNKYVLQATSPFGIKSQLILTVNRKEINDTSTQPLTETRNATIYNDMFVEIVIGPREANLRIIVDGEVLQDKVEQIGTIKTLKATHSLIIRTPRPNSIKVAINGKKQLINTGDAVEWKFIEGKIIRSIP